MNREVLNGLLTKLGVEQPERFDDDRANAKLKTRLTKNGVPADLSDDEKALTEGLGFSSTPSPVTEIEPAEGGSDGDPSQNDDPKATKKLKAKGKGKPAPAPKATKGAGAKPPAKTSKSGTGKAAAANPKPTKATAEGEDKPKREKSNANGVSEIFRKAFSAMNKPVKKEELRAKLLAAGCKPGTANSYVAWAKRKKAGAPGPGGNPWGFVIEETVVGKTNEKVLRKVKDM